MATDADYAKRARGMLKAELKRRDVGYRRLAELLNERGATETEASITNKISRGTFTAAFLLQCLDAVGCQVIRLGEP